MKKAIFCIFMLCLTAFRTFADTRTAPLAGSKSADVAFKGDANGDGSIGLADVMIMVDYILGQQPKDIVLWAADINGDGEVSATDVMIVADIIIKGGETAPGTDDGTANPDYPVLTPPKCKRL